MATINNQYTMLGKFTVVPAADVSSAASSVNLSGDTRKGKPSLGKKAGMTILSDEGSGVYKMYIALGATPTSKWQLCDGSAQVTPS